MVKILCNRQNKVMYIDLMLAMWTITLPDIFWVAQTAFRKWWIIFFYVWDLSQSYQKVTKCILTWQLKKWTDICNHTRPLIGSLLNPPSCIREESMLTKHHLTSLLKNGLRMSNAFDSAWYSSSNIVKNSLAWFGDRGHDVRYLTRRTLTSRTYSL